ncbi:MAG: SpoIID/LytB domain-containing protein [Candidatus Marinimicrobia bacterium]|nr:SpoIID/LytB domain-containing protein [Candidatus Neomarinimicrobiota bacterium]
MLEPGEIPEIEPNIRVGIILPEDERVNISIELPADQDYLLVDTNSKLRKLKKGKLLNFRIDNEQCFLDRENSSLIKSTGFKIVPVSDDYKMKKKAGVKVKNVVSGRSFHWKKNIDVNLTGSIEIIPHINNIILINELPLEEYLMCVATSEMGITCPDALLESQTIIARSWILANVEQKHRHLGMDVCNDDCCQRYQGTNNLSQQSTQGARNTFGQVLIYENSICDTRYSKSCGGVLESFNNVWNGASKPYLKPIPDAPADFNNSNLPLNTENKVNGWITSEPETFCSPHYIPEEELIQYLGSIDKAGRYFRWEFHYTQEELTALLNKKCALKAEKIIAIKPVKRGYSGRLIKLRIEYLKNGQRQAKLIEDQYRIRECFHESFLYSSAFIVEPDSGSIPPTGFTLKGAGWGHGVGYCQIGALGMALHDYSTEDILSHYYPGAKLIKIY